MNTFSKQNLIDCNPCRDGLEFAESCNFDFAKIYDTCERGDWMIWLLDNAKAINQVQAVGIACLCARRSLKEFEKEYPKDNRPRMAIEAAEKWAKEPTEENKNAANAAAYAAYAAAYAAYAAANAAYAAANAANAAAYAAYAAAYAANAAERKWQADEIRKLIPNPFK